MTEDRKYKTITFGGYERTAWGTKVVNEVNEGIPVIEAKSTVYMRVATARLDNSEKRIPPGLKPARNDKNKTLIRRG